MKLQRKRITDAVVEKLPIRDQRYEVRDTDDRLWVRVSPTRIKSWLVYYKVHGGDGRQRRLTIGRYPKMKTKEARDQARRYMDMAKSGIDPAEPQSSTFKQVAQEWFDSNTAGAGTKASYESILRLHLNPHIGDMELHDIDTATLAKKVTMPLIKANKRGIARKVKGVGIQVYKHAFGRGLVTLNPFEHLQEKELAPPKQSAGKVLTPADIKTVWAITEGEKYPYGPLIRLLLLTGQRRGDWQGAVWDEFADDWWTIPAERYKTAREHRVYLAEPTRQILDALPRWSSPHLFVTKAHRANKLVPAQGATAWWNDHVKPELSDGFRLHDLRHTLSTVLAEDMAVQSRVIRAVTGHSESGIGKTYTHAEYAEQRQEALTKYAEWVMACL